MSPFWRRFWTATAGYFLFFPIWTALLEWMQPAPDRLDAPRLLAMMFLSGPALGLIGLLLGIGFVFWFAAFFAVHFFGPPLDRIGRGWPLILDGAVAGAPVGWGGSYFITAGFRPDHTPGLLAGMITGGLAALLFRTMRPRVAGEVDEPGSGTP